MSGTYDGAPEVEPTPAEQHLGDRLAALVDGELGHETRERVLAHLATCRSCKAEADAQRRLKSVFADTTPPPPSESLLARLQGLPAGLQEEESGPGGPANPSKPAWEFGYLPSGSALTPERGFRIHETDRSPSRGRRFAFAAAGAVSLAAFALGGALTSTTTGGSTTAAGEQGGATAEPLRTAAVGAERGGERTGGRPGERDTREGTGSGTSGGTADTDVPAPVLPTAHPTPLTATRPAPQPSPRAEDGVVVREYVPMAVPVLDVVPTLHPPLIRPMRYAQLPVTGPRDSEGSAAQPFAAAPSPSATVGTTAVPVPNIPPNR